MSFRDLHLKHSYTSEKDNILEDFYIPVLKESINYKRVTGYFSSSSFMTAAAGLSQFIKNGGHMQFILNIVLSDEDYKQIEKGVYNPEEIIEEKLIHDLSQLEDEFMTNHVKLLGWLIAYKYLEVKIGYIKDKRIGNALLHQKIGIFTDKEDNTISFSGSNNESAYGWVYNSEKFKVFFSWTQNNDIFIAQDVEEFNELWDNKSLKTEVIPFPEAVKRKVISIVDRESINIDKLLDYIAKCQEKRLNKLVDSTKFSGTQSEVYPHASTESQFKNGFNGVSEGSEVNEYSNIRLRDYQREAIEAWFKNGCRGIFEMATGTGKTYTALGALKQLLEREEKLITIISVPFLHLANQWEKSLHNMGIRTPIIHVSSANPKWREELKTKILDNRLDKEKQFVILTTHDSLATSLFIELMHDVKSPIFLIGDEVHGLGAVTRLEALLPLYNYRLGLSATPERYFDELGTQELIQFFDRVVYVFDLHRAINEINPDTGETYLVPYEYYPIFVELTDEDMSEYTKLSGQIAILCNKKSRSKLEQLRLEQLLRERQDIIKNTQTKYPAFEALINNLVKNNKIKQTLVYCSPKQIETVQQLLRRQKGIIQHRFTSKEDAIRRQKKYCNLTEREYLLDKFAKGDYDVLVAIRCLDEGVDVPATRNAILMCSSGNPKEYIQRRGRVLRRAPGKDKAVIYDITAIPSKIWGRSPNIDIKALESQLRRLEEFAEDAMNQGDVKREIFKVRQKYNAYGGGE
jgi:superfamily II DNA or RNA helicase